MTTITLDSHSSTTGRLEELVDRLLAALFSPDSEQPDTGAQPGQDGPRGAAVAAVRRPGRVSGGVR